MEENQVNILDESLMDCYEALRELEPGTEKYAAVAKEIERFYKIIGEQQKTENTYQSEIFKIETDAEIQRAKLEAEKEKTRLDNEQRQDEKKFEVARIAVPVGTAIITLIGERLLNKMYIKADLNKTKAVMEFSKTENFTYGVKPKDNFLDKLIRKL